MTNLQMSLRMTCLTLMTRIFRESSARLKTAWTYAAIIGYAYQGRLQCPCRQPRVVKISLPPGMVCRSLQRLWYACPPYRSGPALFTEAFPSPTYPASCTQTIPSAKCARRMGSSSRPGKSARTSDTYGSRPNESP